MTYSSKPSRVFITQSVRNADFEPARDYGELVLIEPRSIYPDEVDDRAPDVARNCAELLVDFGPRDYLLLAGDMAIVAIAAATLARRHKSFNMLKWDGAHAGYYVVPFAQV